MEADAGTPIVVRGRITKVNAEKFKDAPITGIDLAVEFDAVNANGKFLEVWFDYHAIYREKVGQIDMKGFLMFEMEEVRAKQIADTFKDEKTFDPSFGESLVNNINYKCSTEAIFAAKLVELTAPIVPPRISLRMPAPRATAAAGKPAANMTPLSNPLKSVKGSGSKLPPEDEKKAATPVPKTPSPKRTGFVPPKPGGSPFTYTPPPKNPFNKS
jgi:hypothetical protein